MTTNQTIDGVLVSREILVAMRKRCKLNVRQWAELDAAMANTPSDQPQGVPVAPDRPTHTNPPPGTDPSGAHRDNDGLDAWRKPACCGSCPGGCVIQNESK